jgi:two-component system, cell cycle response regulator DivK
MGKPVILVIEDNSDNLNLVRFLLENAGYDVMAAANGLTGLEIANTLHVDLVLLDLTLPEVDGWTLAQMLKSDPATAAIPLVAITAHTLPGDRKRALSAGCDGYISKPLNIPQFIEQIQTILQAH